MLCFSSQLNNPTYKPAADRLFAALDLFNIKYKLLNKTKDIWLRDFMPVRTRSGKYVSFRYEPSYLKDNPDLKTDFKADVLSQLDLPDLTFSDINLDGGNVVFSPSKEKVIISNRVFLENPGRSEAEMIRELENLLEADVIIIPSLKSDMTGHADGMVRFLDEKTVLVNRPLSPHGFETKVKKALCSSGFAVLDFPFVLSGNDSAVGCYLNFLLTNEAVFLPVFRIPEDKSALKEAQGIFGLPSVAVPVRELAEAGGCLNCISWEYPN